MASIDTLINNISNQNIRFFFENKISSFKPEKDVFIGTVNEETPYSDPVKIGHAELKNHEELLVFTCEYNKELTARSAKKQQFEIAKKVLKEDFKDGAIFIFYDTQGNFRFSFIRRNYGEKPLNIPIGSVTPTILNQEKTIKPLRIGLKIALSTH